MKIERIVSADAEAAANAMAHHFERAAAEAIAERGRFSCALTGGSSATLLYPRLAQADVDWAQVDIFFGDERVVPSSHPDSNFKLAQEALLLRVRPKVHRVRTELGAQKAAEAYARILPPLDVVHLGLGPDGHVCSLFPGHALLAEKKRWVAEILDSPKPPSERVTLTLPALAGARALWFLALGDGKRAAVADALENTRSQAPAALALGAAKKAVWFLDAASAAELKTRQ